MRDHANSNRTVSARATTDAAAIDAGTTDADTIDRTPVDTAPSTANTPDNVGPSTVDKLDEALACLRKYSRQSAVDVSELETGIRRVRSRIASRVPESLDA